MSRSVLEAELSNPNIRLAFEQDWLHQEFVTQLDHYMAQSNMMRKTLAEKMGKQPAFISKALQLGHNLTINSMVHIALAAGYRVNVILTPFVEGELPKSVFTDTETVEPWQSGSIIRLHAANDNHKKSKSWEDEDDGLEFAAAA